MKHFNREVVIMMCEMTDLPQDLACEFTASYLNFDI